MMSKFFDIRKLYSHFIYSGQPTSTLYGPYIKYFSNNRDVYNYVQNVVLVSSADAYNIADDLAFVDSTGKKINHFMLGPIGIDRYAQRETIMVQASRIGKQFCVKWGSALATQKFRCYDTYQRFLRGSNIPTSDPYDEPSEPTPTQISEINTKFEGLLSSLTNYLELAMKSDDIQDGPSSSIRDRVIPIGPNKPLNHYTTAY